MITPGVIHNGRNYLTHHLRKNDYWAEGEREVQGEWIGLAAEALGLSGTVTDDPFDALRENRHPQTGEQLTARERKHRVAFSDIQLSAPKDVSVLAMVGNDERVREAFIESVKMVLGEMERYAAVRERRGNAATTEAFRLTGNFVGGLFIHDASRALDPQLHAHAVLANATWDAERNAWFALQPAEMIRASPYLRQVLYRELAGRIRALGYEPYDMSSTGFSVRGVEHLRERFSKRSNQVNKLAEELSAKKGRKASKGEVEVLVRESRGDKLTEASTEAVRMSQRAELTKSEARGLDDLVRAARAEPLREQWSHGQARVVLDAALRHVYERSSVAREGVVLSAALEFHPDFFHWRELREALATHPDVIRKEGEMTLRSICREEALTVQRVVNGKNQRFGIGGAGDLPETLTVGQRNAAKAILRSRDFVSVLVGDAGTGKTTVLTAIEQSHLKSGGQRFMPLAPTTKARDALVKSGFESADTVQQFLVSQGLQSQAVGRVVLVDEAGLLSTRQLDQLTQITYNLRARLLLVGDTKQHYSVERGDALRNVIINSQTPVARLAEVLRQRNEEDRQFSRLLASGEVADAFEYADRRGLIREAETDDALFAKAAEHYVANQVKGIETLVVIPFWDEIDRFNAQARPALRDAGLLGETEVVREAVKPLTWTLQQRAHWNQYQVGDRLLFARDTRFFKRGAAAEVVAILRNGLIAKGADGREAKITRKQSTAFNVGRVQALSVAKGDKILIRGHHPQSGLANGDFKEVALVEPETCRVVFTDGKELPTDFAAWTYGHALTSYRSQGTTSEESLLVLGEVATRALARRQFYVGNTRFRGAHAIYVSQKEEIFRRLSQPDRGRELATEFVERRRLAEREQMTSRVQQNLSDLVRRAQLSDAMREEQSKGQRYSL
ncbi:conjugal transfer protein [Nibricoccus aquaticus]|uniref:Conjugal transfer protein n=1 Tax=Nibricoccus aquaticus TaxID=2576891 RepID=A0A290Q834_9BACT|nr:MobF family relaxase [Nibricoccus aquaticus]ATC64809.1 conjugal transfer protein [Nibricoccus aquaticus]